MKNRRQSDKFNIDLDLTSMLDVIFVILMVVMCRQLLSNVQESKTLQETVAELEAAQADNKIYEMHLHDLENPDEGIAIVTVYANYEGPSPRIRHLRMMLGDSPVIEDIVMMSDNEDKAYADFTAKLRSFLSEKEGIPVLLRLDEEKILYRDHIRLEEILSGLKDEYKDLYVRPYGSGE